MTHGSKKTGEAKKQGAGGKGTWGVPGSELDVEGTTRDRRDPNYVSDEDDDVVFETASSGPRPMAQFKESIRTTVKEYLVGGDVEECVRRIEEATPGDMSEQYYPMAVKYAISVVLDFNNHEKEQLSLLFPRISPSPISRELMARGFHLALNQLEDWVVDCPNAVDVVAQFIARAVVDEVIFPAFFQNLRGRIDPDSLGFRAAEIASTLLETSHGFTSVAKVWLPGDTNQEVKEEIIKILEEYIVGHDWKGACQCIRDLEAPSYQHELVKKAISLSMSQNAETRAAVHMLFVRLGRSEILSPRQYEKGVRRVLEVVGDLQLDNPNAKEVIREFVAKGLHAGLLSETINVE